MIEIYADMRESRSKVIAEIAAMDGYHVSVGSLSSGDYRLSAQVIVERKAAVDFIASIMDKRIFEQVAKMKLEYTRPIVLIEGDVFKTRSAIDRKAIAGAMSWIHAIEDVSIITLQDPKETPIVLATMARHLQEGLGYEVSLRANKPKPSGLMARYMIEGLPGVGALTAKKLFAHFGSPLKAFNASIAELSQVQGIGLKSAERIYAALRYEEEAALQEIVS